MIKCTLALAGMLIAAGWLLSTPLASQEKKAPEKAQNAWAKLQTPGEKHRVLGAMKGSWQVMGKVWNRAGDKQTEFTGTAKFEPLFGGRFVQEKIFTKGERMAFGGLGIYGYDARKKVYTLSWFGSSSTGTVTMEGTPQDSENKIVLSGEEFDPARRQVIPIRRVINFKDGSISAHMFELGPDGKEIRKMHLIYFHDAKAGKNGPKTDEKQGK